MSILYFLTVLSHRPAASDPKAIKGMFDEIVEAYGTVDVLVNNAGITRDTLVMRMKPEQWQAVIDTNLSGVFYCTQAFFKVASKKRTALRAADSIWGAACAPKENEPAINAANRIIER